jgi:hypothetical protein
LQVICLIGYSPFILALIIYPDMPLRISPWRPSLKGRNTHPPCSRILSLCNDVSRPIACVACWLICGIIH